MQWLQNSTLYGFHNHMEYAQGAVGCQGGTLMISRVTYLEPLVGRLFIPGSVLKFPGNGNLVFQKFPEMGIPIIPAIIDCFIPFHIHQI